MSIRSWYGHVLLFTACVRACLPAWITRRRLDLQCVSSPACCDADTVYLECCHVLSAFLEVNTAQMNAGASGVTGIV